MPAAKVHEAIAKKINVDYNMDDILLRLGSIAPDCWRNADTYSGIKSKHVAHFWNFKIKDGQANNYKEFYLKYYDKLDNPFYFGYLLHLITDQYWKSNIDPIYFENKKCKLKDGRIVDNIDHFGYYEELKMQKMLASKYNLGELPINKEDIPNFDVNIDEINLSGLFGDHGTIKFVNGSLDTSKADEEPLLYDFNTFEQHIDDTVNFIKKELINLGELKEDNDKRIKIAVDIDDTLLRTKELEDHYWKEFLANNPDVDPNQEYTWGNPILTKFWDEYREKMAFGKVNDHAPEALIKLIDSGCKVDLLSTRPLYKYAHLKQRLVDYFEELNINYNYLYIGLHSKIEFLQEHKYDILIDNEIKQIMDAQTIDVTPILYGHNPNYNGYQTDNWQEIPYLVQTIINNKSKKI